MPIVDKKEILNLRPIDAYSRWLITWRDYGSHSAWVRLDFDSRHMTTFVYVDGVYVGTGTNSMTTVEIIEKFNL